MVRIEAQLHADEAAIVWAAIERARTAAAAPHADALVQVARSFDPGSSDAAARRAPEVVMHVRQQMLGETHGSQDGVAMGAVLDDGRRVPAETLRRVAATASPRRSRSTATVCRSTWAGRGGASLPRCDVR